MKRIHPSVWLVGIVASFVGVAAIANPPPNGWREVDMVENFDGAAFAAEHGLDRNDFYVRRGKLLYRDSVAQLTTSQLPLLAPVEERVSRNDLIVLLIMKQEDQARYNALLQATKDSCDTKCAELFDEVEARLGQ